MRDPQHMPIDVIIPALNEEQAIGGVIEHLPQRVRRVIVVDNGSCDRTAEVARRSGAQVVHEPRRGYGSACLAGIAALENPGVVVFMDADGSDDPAGLDALVEPILNDRADLVIGSRTSGHCEAGALTPQQRFGNALACWLMRRLWGARFTDLGPFRAITYTALQRLRMDDRDYGWTVQMQVRAARFGLRLAEVPVDYRRRIGQSKISGTVRGVIAAGSKILYTIAAEAMRSPAAPDRLMVFARYPEPGRCKTRLIPALGANGAASLHRLLVQQTLAMARQWRDSEGGDLDTWSTGADPQRMADEFGRNCPYHPQMGDDLGDRLAHAFQRAFSNGSRRVAAIGTDCIQLTPLLITDAFIRLRKSDVVLGPAQDGGYYLIAMRRFWPQLFHGITWGSDRVLQQTLANAKAMDLSADLLRPLPDIDRPADLAMIPDSWSDALPMWNRLSGRP